MNNLHDGVKYPSLTKLCVEKYEARNAASLIKRMLQNADALNIKLRVKIP